VKLSPESAFASLHAASFYHFGSKIAGQGGNGTMLDGCYQLLSVEQKGGLSAGSAGNQHIAQHPSHKIKSPLMQHPARAAVYFRVRFDIGKA
jgi:hypothetical protein